MALIGGLLRQRLEESRRHREDRNQRRVAQRRNVAMLRTIRFWLWGPRFLRLLSVEGLSSEHLRISARRPLSRAALLSGNSSEITMGRETDDYKHHGDRDFALTFEAAKSAWFIAFQTDPYDHTHRKPPDGWRADEKRLLNKASFEEALSYILRT